MLPTSKLTAGKYYAFILQTRNLVTEAQFQLRPYKLHKLEKGPNNTTVLTKQDGMKLYSQMQTMRRMENSANVMYKERVIRGFCHLYAGQEAVGVGIRTNMKENDTLITSYRDHSWSWLMGVPLIQILAELAGRRSGCVKGKGGSMHIYTKKFFGGNGIVGAQIPLGTGSAFAHKYKGDGGLCVALHGDGAQNQGQIFESYNMAMLWKLPCLFVCENNWYGMATEMHRGNASTEFYTRGHYIPGIWSDGMDVLTMREAVRFAFEYIRSGNGPMVMEAETYRYYGHSMSDPGTGYRTREEVQDMRQSKDPIMHLRDEMIAANMAILDEFKEIDLKIKKEVDDTVKKAREDSEIGLEEVSYDVYSHPIEPVIRGVTPFKSMQHKVLGACVNFQ